MVERQLQRNKDAAPSDVFGEGVKMLWRFDDVRGGPEKLSTDSSVPGHEVRRKPDDNRMITRSCHASIVVLRLPRRLVPRDGCATPCRHTTSRPSKPGECHQDRPFNKRCRNRWLSTWTRPLVTSHSKMVAPGAGLRHTCPCLIPIRALGSHQNLCAKLARDVATTSMPCSERNRSHMTRRGTSSVTITALCAHR